MTYLESPITIFELKYYANDTHTIVWNMHAYYHAKW